MPITMSAAFCRFLAEVGLAPTLDEPCALVGDKGYHSRDLLSDLRSLAAVIGALGGKAALAETVMAIVALRCRPQAAISDTSRSRSPMRRSANCNPAAV
jgi:hypothetical protein